MRGGTLRAADGIERGIDDPAMERGRDFVFDRCAKQTAGREDTGKARNDDALDREFLGKRDSVQRSGAAESDKRKAPRVAAAPGYSHSRGWPATTNASK